MREPARAHNAGERPDRRPARVRLAASVSPAALLAAVDGAHAASFTDILAPHEWAVLGLNVGIVVFGVVTGISLLRQMRRSAVNDRARREEIARLKLAVDRAEALLMLDPHVVVVWSGAGDEPEISGDPSLFADLPAPRRVLAFGAWAAADQAAALDAAVTRLRGSGEAFVMEVMTLNGRHVEAAGRPIGGQAVLRLRLVDGVRRDLADTREQLRKLSRDTTVMRDFLENLSMPVWMRGPDGKLTWANKAYATATEAADGRDAVTRGVELLEPADRNEAARARTSGAPFAKRIMAVSAGARRVFDAIERPAAKGSAGLALDVTELETVRSELVAEMETHKRTLDQLATAVAIYDSGKRLVFHNEAFRLLWGLDPAFLNQEPADGAVLDKLRELGRLPEQPNFRSWKLGVHAVYQKTVMEPEILEWSLPDGRFLRVVQNPDPTGGVTYVFEDLTQRFQLESQVAALSDVQRETLDHLDEAVAVFASDGRLSLNNRAFLMLWDLDEAALEKRPHIDEVMRMCGAGSRNAFAWPAIKTAVASIADERRPQTFRLDRADASVLDVGTAPLPDGGTLVTFRNVTDQVMIERALTERNEALEAAARIKNDFVHHVSYQLRTPLTTIIGFAQVLGEDSIGPLNPRQKEYLGYIRDSSATLESVVNDVLDLATIDAGVMKLQHRDVDVRAALTAAARAVKERCDEAQVRLEVNAADEIGVFRADPDRLMQILTHLLANAVGFSEAGGVVTLTARRADGKIIFIVRDHGVGIEPDMQERVFERFETYAAGTRHRGAGLGLSVVRALALLHGGEVTLDSSPGAGTTVTVALPARDAGLSEAAE